MDGDSRWVRHGARPLRRVGLALFMAGLALSAQAQEPEVPPGKGTAGDPYQISRLGHLVWMSRNCGSFFSATRFTLTTDIDATETAKWNNGEGFPPIDTFLGVFNGNGKVISNLTINLPNRSTVGFIGKVVRGGVVTNLGLVGITVKGLLTVGGLAGENSGTLSDCHITGRVTQPTGNGSAGGLVGLNGGTIRKCYASVDVSGGSSVGGLIGVEMGYNYALGDTGQETGRVTDCYATGKVSGKYHTIGGLIGFNNGQVSHCYAVGKVTGGNRWVGGFAGKTGTRNKNGDIEWTPASAGCYWDISISGLSSSAGGQGKSTAAMKQQATFEGWDFETVWRLSENASYPTFRTNAPSASVLAKQTVSDQPPARNRAKLKEYGVTGKPVLAIISRLGKSPVADMVFAELAGSDQFSLVERQRLDLIAKERALSAFSMAENVRLGRILKADALLFLEMRDNQLHAVLVETARGIRLCEGVHVLAGTANDRIVQAILRQIQDAAIKFSIPPSARHYLALMRPEAKGSLPAGLSPEIVESLLAINLSQLPEVIVVERENLEAVIGESHLAGMDAAALETADFVLRAACRQTQEGQAEIVLQVKGVKSQLAKAKTFVVDRTAVAAGFRDLTVWVGGEMAVRPPDLADLSAEAAMHFANGLTYGSRGQIEPALQSLRVAQLLDPTNKDYAVVLARNVCVDIQHRDPGATARTLGRSVEAMDLFQYRLGQKVFPFPRGKEVRFSFDDPLVKFLAELPGNLPAEDHETLPLFHRRFREYAEWVAGYPQGPFKPPYDKAWLRGLTPFFFDQPDEAMAYFRKLIDPQAAPLSWQELLNGPFPAVRHWDRTRAVALWRNLMKESAGSGNEDAQYAAFIFEWREWRMKTGGDRGIGGADNPDICRAFFKWVAEKSRRQKYVMLEYPFLVDPWNGFACMDLEFQKRYFEPIMMPRAMIGEPSAVYVFVRVLRMPSLTAEEKKHFTVLLNAFLRKVPLNRDFVKIMEKGCPDLLPLVEPEIQALMAKAKEPGAELPRQPGPETKPARSGPCDYPEVTGATLVFDYYRDVPESVRSRCPTTVQKQTLADDNNVWGVFTVSGKTNQGMVIVRIPAATQQPVKTVFLPAPVIETERGRSPALSVIRWKDNLCILERYNVCIVPLSAGDGMPDPGKVVNLRTDHGLLGHQDDFPAGIIAGGDGLYVSVARRDFNARYAGYGALFRWKPGMAKVEPIFSSESLNAGPLNDSLPYTIDGGKLSDDGKYLLINVKVGSQPGWWRFDLQGGGFEYLGKGSPTASPYVVHPQGGNSVILRSPSDHRGVYATAKFKGERTTPYGVDVYWKGLVGDHSYSWVVTCKQGLLWFFITDRCLAYRVPASALEKKTKN